MAANPMASIIMEQYIEGKLSKSSENKAKHWSEYIVIPN